MLRFSSQKGKKNRLYWHGPAVASIYTAAYQTQQQQQQSIRSRENKVNNIPSHIEPEMPIDRLGQQFQNNLKDFCKLYIFGKEEQKEIINTKGQKRNSLIKATSIPELLEGGVACRPSSPESVAINRTTDPASLNTFPWVFFISIFRSIFCCCRLLSKGTTTTTKKLSSHEERIDHYFGPFPLCCPENWTGSAVDKIWRDTHNSKAGRPAHPLAKLYGCCHVIHQTERAEGRKWQNDGTRLRSLAGSDDGETSSTGLYNKEDLCKVTSDITSNQQSNPTRSFLILARFDKELKIRTQKIHPSRHIKRNVQRNIHPHGRAF